MPERDPPSPIEDPVQKMNRMYRWTRHVYDLSRRYYLLGRDDMLDDIAGLPSGNVLEIGCGTARNLRVLDEWAPHHTLYGLDASLSMLATARAKLDKANCTRRITLGHGLAQDFDPENDLRGHASFDVIFFSYVLSMIPSWKTALQNALTHLAPDGRLYIVDFWDQAGLPDWTATALRQWLALFDVHPPDVPNTLARLDRTTDAHCTVEAVAHRYAYRARLRCSGAPSASVLDALCASRDASVRSSTPDGTETPPTPNGPPKPSSPVSSSTVEHRAHS